MNWLLDRLFHLSARLEDARNLGYLAGYQCGVADARNLEKIRETPLATLAQERRLRVVRDGGE